MSHAKFGSTLVNFTFIDLERKARLQDKKIIYSRS